MLVLGRAVLAFLPQDEVDIIISSNLEKLTENTITSPKKLYDSLKKVRKNGYAVSQGERTTETVGVACSIFDSNAEVLGCIVVNIPDYRYNKKFESTILKAVRNGAETLSRLMGLSQFSTYPPEYRIIAEKKKT